MVEGAVFATVKDIIYLRFVTWGDFCGNCGVFCENCIAVHRFAFTIPAEGEALLNVHIREHGFACIVGADFYGLCHSGECYLMGSLLVI